MRYLLNSALRILTTWSAHVRLASASLSISIYTKQAAYSLYYGSRDLLSEKTPSTASRKLPSASSRSQLLISTSGASGFSQSALRNPGSLFLTLSSIGVDRERPTIPTLHRRDVDRGRVEDKTGRRDDEEVRAWSHCREEEVRVSAAERTRADSHYTRIPAVISGRRISRIRQRRVVVVKDPRSLFFSTRVPSFGSRLIRLSYRSATLLIPSPYTKEFVHSLTP